MPKNDNLLKTLLAFDTDGDGVLKIPEVLIAYHSLGLVNKSQKIENLEKSNTVFIPVNDAYDIISSDYSQNNAEKEVEKLFQFLDTKKTGQFNASDLLDICKLLCNRLTEQQLESFMKPFINDGVIHYKDLIKHLII